jgi:hypothetical protein
MHGDDRRCSVDPDHVQRGDQHPKHHRGVGHHFRRTAADHDVYRVHDDDHSPEGTGA